MTNNIKIGLFVILAVILLILGLLAFGAKTYITPKTRFETAIPGEVYGLSVGSRVELRGVPIGKVSKIGFSWHLYPKSNSRFIVVLFDVDHDLVPLPPGADMKTAVRTASTNGLRAIVKSQGITGTSLLALERLDPEKNPPLSLDYTPRNLYVPSAPGQFTRMLESVEKSLDNFQRLDFASIGQGVTNALTSVRQLSEKIDKVDLQHMTSNINSLLTDIKGTSTKLTSAIEDARKTLDNMKLTSVSENLDRLLVSFRETNLKVQTVLENLGTVPVRQTAADLAQVLQNLNDVLVELKQYPSGFIFGGPPRPVKGMAPAKP